MPPRQRWSKVSSRSAFAKYFAIPVAKAFVGSWP